MYSAGNTSSNSQQGMSTISTPLSNAVAAKNSLLDSNKKITIFIGNVSDYSSDEFMQSLMSTCGVIENWKRVLGSNGKYQSFGFCEFQDQEAGLRAMRLLNGFKIGDKPLVVKVDAKTRALLDEYENKNKFLSNKRLAQQKYQLPISAMTFIRAEQDAKSQEEIDKLIEQNSVMLSGKSTSGNTLKSTNFTNEDGQVSDETLDPAASIGNKRDSIITSVYMDEDDIAYEKKRHERKKLENEKLFKDKIKRWESYENYLADELHHYQSKLKRKLKRRKDYEDKLRKFVNNYDDDIDDEKYYKNDAWEEKLNFRNEELESDEQDVKDELNELEEQRRIREKELQEKVNKLKVELPKLCSEKGDKTESISQIEPKEITQKEPSSYNMDVIMVRPVSAVEIEENTTTMSESITNDETTKNDAMISPRISLADSTVELDFVPGREIKTKTVDKKQEWSTISGDRMGNSSNDVTKEKKTFGIKLNTTASNTSASQISNSRIVDSDISQLGESVHDDIYVKKKTKLTMITDAEHKEVPLVELPPGYHAESLTPEEKKKRIKKIISSIPTDKEELFVYKVMWDHVDKKLMEERIKPWVSRKIKELIGVEENTLVDFICTKVYQQSKPQEIIGAISMILENESEEFTIKLWRFLIYEATAKMYGLNECSKPLKS